MMKFEFKLFMFLVVASVSTAFSNVAVAQEQADLGVFSKYAADAVLDSLDGRTWLVTNGAMDNALSVRAKARGIDLVLVPYLYGHVDTKRYFEQKVADFNNPKLDAAASLGPIPFVVEWLRSDPTNATQNLAMLIHPTIYRAAGYMGVPHGLVTVPVLPENVTNERLLSEFEHYQNLRDEMGGAIATLLPEEENSEMVAKVIRSIAVLRGNNLGYLLYYAELKDKAWDAFSLAYSLDRTQMSPLLNMAVLVESGMKPEMREKLGQDLNRLNQQGRGSWDLAGNSGYVLKPEKFVPAQWYWAGSGIPAWDSVSLGRFLGDIDDQAVSQSVQQRLQLSLAMQLGGAQAALEVMSHYEKDGGFTSKFMLRVADYYRIRGDLTSAAEMIERAAAAPEPNLMWLAHAKAEVYPKIGRHEEAIAALRVTRTETNALDVLSRVASVYCEMQDYPSMLPVLEEIEDLPDAPEWAQSIRRVVSRMISGNMILAKSYMAKATEQGVDYKFAYRLGLMVSLMTQDDAGATDYSDKLLKLAPHDYFANYIRATLYHKAKQYKLAENHFQMSLSQSKAWFILNDYAMLMLDMGAYDSAGRLAQDALKHGGAEQAAAWDTMGTILLKMKHVDKAKEAFERAIKLPGGNNPLIHLHYADLCLELGEIDKVAESIRVIDLNKEDLSVEDRGRLGRLRRAVEKNKKN